MMFHGLVQLYQHPRYSYVVLNSKNSYWQNSSTLRMLLTRPRSFPNSRYVLISVYQINVALLTSKLNFFFFSNSYSCERAQHYWNHLRKSCNRKQLNFSALQQEISARFWAIAQLVQRRMTYRVQHQDRVVDHDLSTPYAKHWSHVWEMPRLRVCHNSCQRKRKV